MNKLTQDEKSLVLERNRRNKNNFNINSTVSVNNKKVIKKDKNEKLLELMTDKNFVEICKNKDSSKFVNILIKKEIINTRKLFNTSFQDANSTSHYDPIIVVWAIPVVIGMSATGNENENFLRNDINRKCVAIAERLGGTEFKKTILKIFQRLEAGEKVVLG